MADQKPNEDVHKMLSESGYSDKAIAYFLSKENLGILEGANQVTDITGPCGDTMKVSLNIDGSKIRDAKIQVLGCPGAVASGCAVIGLAKGKSLDEAKSINLDTLYRELEKMPDQKVHCARLAIKALHKTIDEYRNRLSGAAADEM
ncbi:MAG TPA: iron-sulfur cluster assembly scaffold protein [Deltaproteobacteria bacterium]|nr:iron-sulfur cluster assembly scaffold protein [Deltaproteobacteria bacterium]